MVKREPYESMSPERLQWKVYFYCHTRKQDIGRPRRKWAQQFL
jgi:hypothetical protein